MEKTLTININGWVFNINEDAYKLLTEYFKNLKKHFSKQEGGDEIVTDIEARVAELFKESIDENVTVINITQVENIMNTMGQPYQMEEDADDEDVHSTKKATTKKGLKKLYRDTMNGHIAGVAAGLGKYINLDPIFIRIAFLLLIPTGGAGVIIYIILWLLIPEAASTSDKIRMEGKKVNVENIQNKVLEEADYIKDKLNDFSAEARDVFNKTQPVRSKGVKKIESLFSAIGKGLLRFIKFLFGLILVLTGIGFLIPFTIFFFNWVPGLEFDTFFVNGMSLPSFLNTFIFDSKYTVITLIALTIVVIIPLLMLVFNGIRFLFNYKRNKTVGLIALQAWIVALIISLGMSWSTINSYKRDALNITSHSFNELKSDTLNIILNTDSYYQNVLTGDSKVILSQDDNFPILHDGEFYGDPKLEIVPTTEANIKLKLFLSANGADEEEANRNIDEISYIFKIDSTSLTLDPYFKITENTVWRNQDVKMKLFIPEGKTIALDRKIRKHFRLRYNWKQRLRNNKEEMSYWEVEKESFISKSEKEDEATIENSNEIKTIETIQTDIQDTTTILPTNK